MAAHSQPRSRSRWLAGLAAAVCSLALLVPVAAQKCLEYQPKTCWFALPADPNKEPIVFPRCAFVDCEFDHTAALVCPFASGGSFAVTDNENCPDFMKVEERHLPDCRQACCGGVVPGAFVAPESDPLALDYRAEQDADCQYFDYRRQEILDKLLGEGIDIVVAGDSMMRQNYLRLVQLMRGKQRIFDYRVHTHASYSYCDEGDAFRTASYMADMKQPEKQYLLDVVPEFFARDGANEPAGCSRAAGRMDFLHAPLFATHGQVVEAYVKQADPQRKLVVVSYVGVWTKVSNIPDAHFASLEAVLAHKPGAVLLSLSVPTAKEVRVPERAAKYRVRNAKMRAWVEAHPGKAGYIDFESLTLTPGGPPNTKNDKHFSCYVTWPQEGRGGDSMKALREDMLKVNSFRERLYDNPVGHLWMTEDGQCYDEMNRAVWVVSLNTIMQIDAVGDAFLLPQGAFDKITPPIYERHEIGKSEQEVLVKAAVANITAEAQAKAAGSGGKAAAGAKQAGRKAPATGGKTAGGSASNEDTVPDQSSGHATQQSAAAGAAGEAEVVPQADADADGGAASGNFGTPGTSKMTEVENDLEEEFTAEASTSSGSKTVGGSSSAGSKAGGPSRAAAGRRSSNDALESEDADAAVPDAGDTEAKSGGSGRRSSDDALLEAEADDALDDVAPAAVVSAEKSGTSTSGKASKSSGSSSSKVGGSGASRGKATEATGKSDTPGDIMDEAEGAAAAADGGAGSGNSSLKGTSAAGGKPEAQPEVDTATGSSGSASGGGNAAASADAPAGEDSASKPDAAAKAKRRSSNQGGDTEAAMADAGANGIESELPGAGDGSVGAGTSAEAVAAKLLGGAAKGDAATEADEAERGENSSGGKAAGKAQDKGEKASSSGKGTSGSKASGQASPGANAGSTTSVGAELLDVDAETAPIVDEDM